MKNVRRATNYLLCYAVIMVSGNPVFRLSNQEFVYIGLFLIVGLVAITRPIQVSLDRVIFFLLMLAICGIHVATIGDMAVNASLGFLIHLAIGMLIASSMNRFLVYYINTMAFIAACSLPLYFLIVLPERIDIAKQIHLFSWRHAYSYKLGGDVYGYSNWVQSFFPSTIRNSGPFWEPGAFAGYLVIALMCCVILLKKNKIKPICVVLITAALLTTMSTTGYVAFVVVIVAWLFQKLQNGSGGLPIVIFVSSMLVLLVGAQIAAEKIPFIQEKITGQLESTEDASGNYEMNRFGNMEYDWRFIKERPFFGLSANHQARTLVEPSADLLKGQGNALSGFVVRFGFVGWFLVLGSFWLSFYRLSSSTVIASLALLSICMMLVGEKYLNYPLLMIFLFLTKRHIDYDKLKVRVPKVRETKLMRFRKLVGRG